MLKSTFLHIPGIGEGTEKYIWSRGILSWNDYIENNSKLYINASRKNYILDYVERSIEAHNNKDHNFFMNLPASHHWRCYNHMPACFLDIETTGLDKHRDQVTVIGLYDGKESKVFINGQNMHEFEHEIKKYPLLVTFNGRCFDVPFLKAKFPEVDLDKFHIDLRFALRNLGYSGGLKNIEKQVGIVRDDDIQGVDGFEAVRLWYRYKKGNQDALDTLVKYNIADIENLKVLMEFAFDKLKLAELSQPL